LSDVWRPLPDWLGGEQPYDLNSWQESETALALADTLDEDAVIVEGYAEYATWRPHLAYLRDPYGDPDMEMELDGVGGVSILAKAKVFRSGVHFPAFSFEKHAETEGFGKVGSVTNVDLVVVDTNAIVQMAKRMKFSVTGLPHYTIWHLYEPSVDDIRHMEEMEAERKQREMEEKERAERMKKIKEDYKDTNSQWEKDKNDIQNIALKEKEQKQAEKAAEREKAKGDRPLTEPAKEKADQTLTKEQLAKNQALKEQASRQRAPQDKKEKEDQDTEPSEQHSKDKAARGDHSKKRVASENEKVV
jgi:mannan polymerase II complex ANP1 subunit